MNRLVINADKGRDAVSRHIYGHLAQSLHHIRVEDNAVLSRNFSNLSKGRQSARFIICIHYCDKYRIIPYRPCRVLRREFGP